MLTPAAWVPAHDAPHPAFVVIRRWGPLAAPLIEAGALVALTLGLLARGRSPYAFVPPSATILVVICCAIAVAVAQGLALHYAPNGVTWSLGLVCGAVLLAVALFSLALGLPAGLLALAISAALWLLYSRLARRQTPRGVVNVTLLMGEWYRVLSAGYNVLAPGERIIATLRVTPRAYTTPLQEVALGGGIVACAHTTITYVVNPQEAWRAVHIAASWEDVLRERLARATCEGLLQRYGPPAAGAAPQNGPHNTVARIALGEIRGWARSVGVRIISVRVHDIDCGPAAEVHARARQMAAVRARAAQPQPMQMSQSRQAPQAMQRAPLTPALGAGMLGDSPRQPVIVEADGVAPAPPETVAPSPAALEDLYAAVRARHITDTTVIRQIAAQFATLARQPLAPDERLPFDALAAARMLRKYADAIDAARVTAPS